MEKKSFFDKIKSAGNISVKDYVLNYSHDGINLFATCVLLLLCAFPLFLNMFFNIYDAVAHPEISVSTSEVYTYLDTWIWILVLLGFFMLILSLYQFIALHYRTGIREVFSIGWLKDRWLPLCLLLLLFWCILSALVSPNLLHSFVGDPYRKDGILTFCIFAVIFLTSFFPSDKQIKIICEVLVAVGVATGFMVALGKVNASLFFFQTQNIANGIFANSNHYGYFLSICFPLLVGLIINDRSKNVLLILVRVAEFWLLTNAVLVSNCRGSFIAIIVAMVGWNVYVLWLHRSNWYSIVIMDVMFLLILFVLNTNNEILGRLAGIAPSIKDAVDSGNEEAIGGLGSGRIALWKRGMELSFAKPILGYGPDNLEFEFPTWYIDKPHNELIEIAASFGYPALIFYLAGMIGQAVLFFKNIKRVSILEVMTFSAVCCYFVSGLFGNVMFYTTPYFYLMLGFSYILLRRTPNAKPLFATKKKVPQPVECIEE